MPTPHVLTTLTNTGNSLYHLVAGRIVYSICTLLDATSSK